MLHSLITASANISENYFTTYEMSQKFLSLSRRVVKAMWRNVFTSTARSGPSVTFEGGNWLSSSLCWGPKKMSKTVNRSYCILLTCNNQVTFYYKTIWKRTKKKRKSLDPTWADEKKRKKWWNLRASLTIPRSDRKFKHRFMNLALYRP